VIAAARQRCLAATGFEALFSAPPREVQSPAAHPRIQLTTHLNRLGAVLDGPAEQVLPPQAATWWILPIFAGIAMAWETTLGVWSLLGDKKEAALYAYWKMATAGFDAVRVLRIMIVVIGVPGAILTLLAVPEHDVLTHDGVLARRYGFGVDPILETTS